MIKTFACGLGGDFFIFAQEGRQLELTQSSRANARATAARRTRSMLAT
jgi:gamma-glutamyltranspeptidase